MKIGIIGHGFVGRATARCFMEHAEVRIYDKVPELCTHSVDETLACDFVFVCLPTPDDCDTRIINRFLAEYVPEGHPAPIVIKSTVPVGTTKRFANRYGLNLIHSPEFLTARCALVDAQCPARMIIGHTSQRPDAAAESLETLYRRRFPGTPIHLMHSDESELVKLACNTLFFSKVWLFNKFREVADHRCLDWEAIRAGILSDGRIAHAHTQVPGPDGLRGAGGACLPKDALAFANLAESGILKDMLKENAAMRECSN